jgi:hypothetical protein
MPARHYRAHQRFLVKLPLTVTSIHRSVSAKGTALDLGVGGAACELDVPLRLGERVQVVVTVDVPRVVSGEVAWVGWAEGSAVRMGVRFNHEDAEELAGILDALGVIEAEVGT